MHMNRRAFLGVSGAAFAAEFIVGPSARHGVAAAGRVWAVEDLTKELFERHVGEMFVAQPAGADEGKEIMVKLAKVHDMPEMFQTNRAGDRVTNGFSVVFEGDTSEALNQGLYRFTNPNLGECTIFVVPVVSRDPERRCYEAAFNRML